MEDKEEFTPEPGKNKQYFAFTHKGYITNLAKFIDGTAYLLNKDREWEQDQELVKIFLLGPDVGDGIFITEKDAARVMPFLKKGLAVDISTAPGNR